MLHSNGNVGTVGKMQRVRVPRQRIILNFPEDLANKVRELAARERRPLSTQIEVLVEQALRQDAVAA